MNKKEFMRKLEENLFGLNSKEIKEILEDYNEHFTFGKKKKRSESEIAESLGDPRKIAREIKREMNKDGSNIFLDAEEIIGKGVSETKKLFKEATQKVKNSSKKNNGKIPKREWEGGLKVTLCILGALILAYIWFSILFHAIFSGGFFSFVFGALFLVLSIIFIKNKLEKRNDSKYVKTFKNRWLVYILVVVVNLILLCPFIWVNVFFIGVTVASFCGILAGLVGSIFSLVIIAFPGQLILEGLFFASLFFCLFLACVSAIVFILIIKLIKSFYKLFSMYVELNKRLLSKEKSQK